MAFWICQAAGLADEAQCLKLGRVFCGDDNVGQNLLDFTAQKDLTLYFEDEMGVDFATAKSWSQECWPFAHEIKRGDIVVLANLESPELHIGKIVGDYEYDPEQEGRMVHFRNVHWFHRTLVRDKLPDDLKSILKFYEDRSLVKLGADDEALRLLYYIFAMLQHQLNGKTDQVHSAGSRDQLLNFVVSLAFDSITIPLAKTASVMDMTNIISWQLPEDMKESASRLAAVSAAFSAVQEQRGLLPPSEAAAPAAAPATAAAAQAGPAVADSGAAAPAAVAPAAGAADVAAIEQAASSGHDTVMSPVVAGVGPAVVTKRILEALKEGKVTLTSVVDTIIRAKGFSSVIRPESTPQTATIVATAAHNKSVKVLLQIKRTQAPLTKHTLDYAADIMHLYNCNYIVLISIDGFTPELVAEAEKTESGSKVKLWGLNELGVELCNVKEKVDENMKHLVA